MATTFAVPTIDAETGDQLARALWMRELDPARIPEEIRQKIASPKNSSAAFGLRMRAYLDNLIRRHNKFIPSYRARYEYLKSYCAELTPHQAYVLANLLGMDTVEGFDLLPESVNLQFPKDHAVSLRHQVGWHFFVGTASDANGKRFGVELMFWQWALLPPPLAANLGLTDIENQMMEVHLSMSEEGGRHYRAAPLLVAGTSGLLEVRDDPFLWRIGKNTIEAQRSGDLFPLRLQARGWDRGGETDIEIALDLLFAHGKGVLLQGANGCSPCCGGVGTLYYSIPGIVLDDERSSIEIDGSKIQLHDGTFWMDHQWGTGFLPAGAPEPNTLRAASLLAPPFPGGWDWFPLQFDDNYEITVAAMHSIANEAFYFQTGEEPPGTMTVKVSGKIMDPDAKQHDISGTLSVTEWVRATHTNDRAYPPSRSWYPNRWEFSFEAPAPPHLQEVVMTALVPGGQTGFFANGAEYLEGATVLFDRSGNRIGYGFGEATAYAKTQTLQARLAGLPDTDETHYLLQRAEPSAFEKLAASLYLMWPPNGAELKRILGCCAKNGLSQ